jgi:hypothetical protein
MFKAVIVLSMVGCFSLFGTQAFACGIQGSVVHKDGSKAGSESYVTTSWRYGDKAWPKRGQYKLELGSNACGKTVDVHFNGDKITRVTLKSKGWTIVNLRGQRNCCL